MTNNRHRPSFPMAILWVRVALWALYPVLASSAFAPVVHRQTAAPSPQRHISSSSQSSALFLSSTNNDDDLIDEESEEFQKAVRVAKARSEIDRILKGPDAPFDLDGELQKVEGISPPLPAEEEHAEEQVSQLESELYNAVKSQDYPLALKKKEEISKLHVDDCGAVLQVNSAFYRAFSEKDHEAMEKLWLQDGSSLCIHPSHAPLVGSNAVLQGWKQMFDSSNGSFQRNWMTPSKIRLTVKGATAVITCDEEVYCRRFIRGKKRQTELVNKLTATNIFRKVSGSWFMVHHHASWHADSEAAKAALKEGGSGTNAKIVNDSPVRRPLLHKRRRQHDVGDANTTPSSKLSMDGILGNLGPDLGPSPAPKREGSPVKRIILGGSLSDILNGGLSDLLGGNSDNEKDDVVEGSIIGFHAIDDDEDDDEENDEDETEAVTIIKEWGKSMDDDDDDSGSGSASSGASSLSTSASGSTGGNAPKDALRQNCISALRKLCVQGSISPKQKRVLLTDIITCSAKGEFSMVEVAYELLCGEGEDKHAAEEEFADQCRVFAENQHHLST